MKKSELLIAHNSIDIINNFKEKLQNFNNIYVSKYVKDGNELINIGSLDNYDIVVIKNSLTYVSGLHALERLLDNTKRRPEHIILLTPFINDFVINKCEQLGIYYRNDVINDGSSLLQLLFKLNIYNSVKNKHFFDTQFEIIRLLKEMGLLKTYLGYTYFEYALNLMFEKGENIYKSMKEIYEIIGNHFNTTPTSVEKAMRNCIKNSFCKKECFYAQILFGYNIHEKDYPSTSTFLQVSVKTLREQKMMVINNSIQKNIRKI